MAVVYYIDKYTERKAYIVKVPEIRMCNIRRAIAVVYYTKVHGKKRVYC